MTLNGNINMQKKKWKWVTFLLISFTLIMTTHVRSEEINVNKADGEREQIFVDILSLILSKSDPEAKIHQNKEYIPTDRLIGEINAGNIDLMWDAVNSNLEDKLLPVRIPLLKGLLGHRIFIIKEGDQPRFDNIQTLADLKKLTAGQGTQWGDTQILKNAGIPVITTLKYPNLFPMLEGERFDYFPRAIHEPWSEVSSHPELNLTVEKNILLVYPLAMYFFVKKGNQTMYEKLSRGLEIAIADGSFDELFFNSPVIKDALQKTNIKNRTVIKMTNPAMHPDTPLGRKELWLDINNLQ